MHILIIGAGLIGVTSAYYLQRQGHHVTVLDRRDDVARETSFANGALITPSMSEPWNAPGSWRILLKSIFQHTAPFKIEARLVPDLAKWGVGFLRNSTPHRYHANARSNFVLARHSAELTSALSNELEIVFQRARSGSLRLFRDSRGLAGGWRAADTLAKYGLQPQRYSAPEVAELEPALQPYARYLAGAIYYPEDEVGDARVFCMALADRARSIGAEFILNTEVRNIQYRANRVTSVLTDRGSVTADHFVLAAGSYSRSLAAQCGINLPIRPVRGYSVSIPVIPTASRALLSVPIIDEANHIVIVPLGSILRIAGFAEFGGLKPPGHPYCRTASLLELFRQVMPEIAFEKEQARTWYGLRAMSMDGVPLIGATPFANLAVNTGHGHLGWTMAVGSGKLLADLLCERCTQIDAAPYAPSRFALGGPKRMGGLA